MRKVTRGGSENFVFTENFQIDNVPGTGVSSKNTNSLASRAT